MAMVKVGCKLPNGLWLELIQCDPNTRNVSPPGRRVLLKGANDSSVITVEPNPATLKYAFTMVDEEFWNEWLKRYKDSDFIRNGSIFVAPMTDKEAAAAAKAHADVKTGLEPMTPVSDGHGGHVFKDSRMPTSAAADQEQMARRQQGQAA